MGEVPRRFAEQDAEARLGAQLLPVAVGQAAQLGIAVEDQHRTLRWAQLAKSLTLSGSTVDQTRVQFGRDLDRRRGLARQRLDHCGSNASIQAKVWRASSLSVSASASP